MIRSNVKVRKTLIWIKAKAPLTLSVPEPSRVSLLKLPFAMELQKVQVM